MLAHVQAMSRRTCTAWRRFRLAGLGVAFASLAIAVSIGGTVGTTQGCLFCGTCARPGGWVSVPAARASDVAGVVVIGTCAAVVRCAAASMSPCTGYDIAPQREGPCHIEVTFTSGAAPIMRDVDFRQFNGCCAGMFSVSGSPDILVPDVMDDAGADGG